MSEERLKDIQDNINERNMFPNRMYIFREEINDEEQELVNEVIRLREIIDKARKMIFDNYGVLDKYEIEMLDDILRGKDNGNNKH